MRCSRARTRSPAAHGEFTRQLRKCSTAGCPSSGFASSKCGAEWSLQNTASRTTLDQYDVRAAARRLADHFSARAILASRSQLHAFGWPLRYSAMESGFLYRSKRGWRTRAHELALFASGISNRCAEWYS